jgi:hypothetical protein
MTNDASLLKAFPNGDAVVDFGNGPVYCTAGTARTPEALYTVELVPPSHPLSDEPFGVDLVRTSRSEHGLEREQRLPLAEYRSYMAAEEHVRETEAILLEQGRDGLTTQMALVDEMPFEPDSAVYLVGLHPPDTETDRASLSMIRVDGEQLDITPVAQGPVMEMAAIEQRLLDVQAGGHTDVFLRAATAEAIWAGGLAPGTPLFASEGKEFVIETASTSPEWEDHPDWTDVSAWDLPPAPKPAALVLPVTFGDDQTPFDGQGRYVPHHRDEAGTVHFFSVVARPSDSPIPADVSHELRYFRAHQAEDGVVVNDSQPVMPVPDPETSPWPLPALHLHLEDGELHTAQALARQVARDHGLPFPHRLPVLGAPELTREPGPGWYHFDAALVSADPQGVDDGYSVGVVDVYANHETEQWAARYLPMGEFDTLDEALSYQQQTLYSRIAEDRPSALTADGFNRSPAVYERIARAETDAALVDLLEQHDGHYPPDYDGGHEVQWEPLTSKEWDAYRDHLQAVSELAPGKSHIRGGLPSATPGFASGDLVAASAQPDAPYLQPEDFKAQLISPTWRLDIVPARDPDGASLGYSAVCVVDFSALAEAALPETPERAQWLEVAQFRTEDRAQQFQQDFMSLAGSDELGHITGPMLAGVIADDLEMDSQWQVMDKPMLEKLNAGEWGVVHVVDDWHPRMGEISSDPAAEPTSPDLDL